MSQSEYTPSDADRFFGWTLRQWAFACWYLRRHPETMQDALGLRRDLRELDVEPLEGGFTDADYAHAKGLFKAMHAAQQRAMRPIRELQRDIAEIRAYIRPSGA